MLLLQPKLFRYIYNVKSILSRIVNGIVCPTSIFRQITNTQTTVIHEVSVSLMHTPAIIHFRGIDYFVGCCLYPLVLIYIHLFPARGLCFARKNKNKLYVRVTFFQFQNRLSCKRIKAQRSTGTKIHISGLNTSFYFSFQTMLDPWALSSLRIKKQGEVKNFCRSHPAGPRRIGLAQSSGKSTLPTKE